MIIAACRRLMCTALVVGLAAGCGGTAPQQPADLVIGASLELTGVGQPAGTAADNALHLALEQVNSAGVTVGGHTRRIRLVIRDNGSDPDTAGRQARTLVDDEKAVALIGGSRVDTAEAIAAGAEATKVPALTLSPGGGGTVRRYVYAVPPSATDVAKALVARLNRDKLSPVAVFAVAGAYGDQGAETVPAALRDAGISVGATTRFEPTGAGPAGAAKEVTAAKPGAAVIWADGPFAGEAASALRTAGYGGRLAFEPGAGGSETLTAANRPAVENGLLVAPGVFDVEGGNPNDPLNLAPQRFTERYTARYGPFSGLAPYASDALGLIVAALGASSSPTAARVRDALESTGYDGIAGRYAYSATNHGGLAANRLVIYRCKQGRWVRDA